MVNPLPILDPLTSVQAFGAVGDALSVTDGFMSTGSATLTCAESKLFKASDVGKSIAVAGAHAAVVNWPQVPVALVTTIARWVSPSEVTLAASNTSGGDVSGAAVNWGTDDSTAFQTGLNALAGTGRALYIPAARYLLAHSLAVPSIVTIVGSAGAYLVSAMAFTGNQTNTIFYATGVGTGNAGKLNGTQAAGADKILYALTAGKAPVAGQILVIGGASPHGNSAQSFVITAVSGSGPYAVMLDRAIVFPFVLGDPCSILSSQPTDIRIYGNGMRMTGTGDRAVELVGAYRCYVEDLHYDTVAGALGDMAFSFDDGGRENGFARCSVDGHGASNIFHAMALEAQDRSFIRDCRITRSVVGFTMVDSFGSMFMNCHYAGFGSTGTGAAYGVGTDGAYGSFDCSVIGCSSSGGNVGLYLNGNGRVKVTDCAFDYASDTGILFVNPLNTPNNDGTEFQNVSAVECRAAGFNLGHGNTNTLVRGLNVSNCPTPVIIGSSNTDTRLCDVNASGATTHVLTTLSDVDIDGLIALNLSVTRNAIQLSAGSLARVKRLHMAHSGTVNAIQCNGASRVEIDGALLNIGISSVGVYILAGVVVLRNVKTLGSNSSTKGVDVTSATVRIGDGCDFSSASIDVSLHSLAYCNRGTVTATEAASKTVAFPDLKANDRVILTNETGTAGRAPTVSRMPGTGFVITSVTGDTGTYSYEIV